MILQTNNLKVLMAQRDETVLELAGRTGLSTRTIVKVKKNQTVRTDTLSRLCEHFGINLPDLFTFTYVESENGSE